MIQTEYSSERQRVIINSALWAAAGDALGWITELSYGVDNVIRRCGVGTVEKPVTWKRMISGRSGPKVILPAGTYSDDTQLRLAVSRCIRNGGKFDPEAFAKIELTVWLSYALGAGLGTKAAAKNLARRNITWYSNFFELGEQRYISSGGNGAAMRVQPHVWARKSAGPELVLSVLKDALITHGHPQGFCGAVFHALILHATIETGTVASPEVWIRAVESFLDIPSILDSDPQLAAFWQAAWESKTNKSLGDALLEMRDASLRDIDVIHSSVKSMVPEEYPRVLNLLGSTSKESRGAGFKTALAALTLAYMHREGSPEEALKQAANELESDTDTIATMTGAILGACSSIVPSWPIQDRDYIVYEAKRMAQIAESQLLESFDYPDLARWSPPMNQLSAIGSIGENTALAGLGLVKVSGEKYRSGNSIWQWYQLPFGQTILAKRTLELKELSEDQVPRKAARHKQDHLPAARGLGVGQVSIVFEEHRNSTSPSQNNSVRNQEDTNWSIDWATDEVIKSNFEDSVIGNLLNRCLDETQSIEQVISFAAIISKARLVRRRRRDRS